EGIGLDTRQTEEFILTAAQTVLGFAVLADLQLHLWEALALLALFALQFPFPQPTVRVGLAAAYAVIAAVLLIQRRRELPRIVRAEDLAHELLVQRVPRLQRCESPEDGHAEQREIPHRVENLVADELVRIAQPFGVEDVEIVDHDGVLQRAAAGEPGGVQPFDVALEPERAGA